MERQFGQNHRIRLHTDGGIKIPLIQENDRKRHLNNDIRQKTENRTLLQRKTSHIQQTQKRRNSKHKPT